MPNDGVVDAVDVVDAVRLNSFILRNNSRTKFEANFAAHSMLGLTNAAIFLF